MLSWLSRSAPRALAVFHHDDSVLFCPPHTGPHGANQYAKRLPPATRRLPRAAAPAAAPWAQQLLPPASSSMKICRHRHSSLQNARSPLHMHARATSQTDVQKDTCVYEQATQKIELATADQYRVPAFSKKKSRVPDMFFFPVAYLFFF